jgi:hypothetical protein
MTQVLDRQPPWWRLVLAVLGLVAYAAVGIAAIAAFTRWFLVPIVEFVWSF